MGRTTAVLSIAALAAGILVLGVAATPVAALEHTVNTEADDNDATPGDGVCETGAGNGVCTLRAAIEEANADLSFPPDIINLPSGTYMVTDGAGGDLDILGSLTIAGAGADATRIESDGRDRVIDIGGDGIVNIRDVTISDGDTSLGLAPGGGILVRDDATAQIFDTIIRDNHASTGGGGIRNDGSLLLRDVEIRENSTPTSIAGGGVTSTGGGLANASDGVVTMERVTIARNEANRGAGINNFGRVRMTNSTISGNTARNSGGGVRNVRVGGDFATGNLTIAFSTITENVANWMGGGDETITGGGIANFGGQVNMGNSILAANEHPGFTFDDDYSPDCWSEEMFRFTSFRGNIVGELTDNCVFRDTIWGDQRFDQVGSPDDPIDPRLRFLTRCCDQVIRTHELLDDSPAIDEGTGASSADFFDCLDHDAVEEPRPIDGDIDGDAACDVGAREYQPPDDGDDVDDATEDGAANGGDGNGDGIPDRLQPAVTSLPTDDGSDYVTFVASEGSVFERVAAITPPAAPPPPGVTVPLGLFTIEATADPDVTVTVLFPPEIEVASYHKYGSEPGDGSAHWYDFAWDGSTGATIAPGQISLRFTDGLRGDDDLIANGRVVDPGGPTGLTPVFGESVLFVANKAAPQIPAPDQVLIDRLIGRGADVTVVGGDDLSPTDPTDIDLVVLSSSVVPGQVGDAFAGLGVPIVSYEQYVNDDMGWTDTTFAGRGDTAPLTDITVVDAGHPIAAGLPPDLVLTSVDRKQAFGVPGGAADIVAATGDGRPGVYTYELGDQLFDGTIALARAVALPFVYATPPALTDDGLLLFDNAVDWAIGGEVAPPPGPPQALLVAGNASPPPPDQVLMAELEAIGFDVEVVNDDEATPLDASGKDLVVISSSVVPTKLAGTFAATSLPIVSWEPFVNDDMGWTAMAFGQRGETTKATTITLVDAGHPIASGLPATPTITGASAKQSFGLPAGSAAIVADTADGRPGAFAYEAGDTLANGSVASARRVALPFTYLSPNSVTPDGLLLFANAVSWATS